MIQNEPVNIKIGEWNLLVSELFSEDNRLYERTYTAWRKDDLGIHREYFDDVVDLVEFAQEQAGQKPLAWPIIEKMAEEAKRFYYRKEATTNA